MTINIFSKVVIPKTNHKQTPLAPPVNTSAFHAIECTIRRERGVSCEMCITHLKVELATQKKLMNLEKS